MSAPADRRRYQRYQIKLPARIGISGGSMIDCEVRDYCSGGMLLFVGANAASAGLAVGRSVTLATEFQTESGPRRIRIDAGVAWAQEPYLGLQFPKPSEGVVAALRRHDRLARAIPDASPASGRPSEGRCLSKMRHVAQGSLPGILRELLRQTLDSLLDTAERVSSDAERQQVYGDLNALESLRKGDLMMREVFAKVFDPLDAGSAEDPLAGAELALVDTDDFERWLEASRAATQLERRFGDQLAAIGSRIAALREGESPATLTVPFEPKNFTDALKSVSKQLELGAVTRGVLFECCVRVLTDSLAPFYSELNAVLDTFGAPQAEPQRGIQIVRQSESGRATPQPPVEQQMQQPMDAPAVEFPAAPPVAIDPQTLQALLERERQVRESQAHELVDSLAAVGGGGRNMGEWLHMIDDALVAEAVSHPAFFHEDEHPLRDIVDALGHLQSLQDPADGDVDQQGLNDRITRLLEPIARGGVDESLMRAIADDVGQLTLEQSQHFQRNVERVAEASEGRDRVRRAREAVIREIARRYAGRKVPSIVPELLDVGWRSVLELAWLNAQAHPGAYAQQLAVLDSLVAHLGGEAFASESPTLDKAEVQARIGTELETAAFDPFRRIALETRLRAELRGQGPDEVSLLEMPLPDEGGVPSAAEARPDGISAAAWQRVLETCGSIRPGDRLRFVSAASAEQVLRVAWIRDDGELFTLVDHRGIRVRDITLAELAVDLHQRRARLEPVDGRPLSGRVVEQMLEEMEERLAHQASHDSLTGLMNRRQFNAALEQAVAADSGGMLLWVDIDQFKLINDMHGYATGDRLLVAVAGLLQQDSDERVIGHLGADRFAALFESGSVDDARRWANQLCESARRMPFDRNSASGALSLSVGIAGLVIARNGIGDLQVAVENALAAAKKAGGDQVYVYRDDDPDIARQRESVKWVARVDEALVSGELRLRCQPIVPVRPGDGMAPHYEVLLGVADGSRNPLPIAEFIEAAERYKRMRAVDRWVTKSVFDWIGAHRQMMPALHGFAVNLSGQTASDPTFVDFVRQQFRRTAIDPDWISFEVTETAAVASLSGTAGIIHELKNFGCKVALDDFGSGLASYSYLKELPVDWLKIDGVFVRNIATDREDYAVVKSINDIGHFLGKKTIAEYVKDQPTLERVRELGVDYAQGFGIAEPLLLDDLPQRVAVQQRPRQLAGAHRVKD